MMRLAAISFTVCAILAMPVLCMAGVLLHPCQCGESIACGHEINCTADPCSDAVRSGSSPRSDDLASPTAAEIPGLPGFALVQCLLVQSHSTWLFLREKNLPASDLPLRI